MGLFLEGVKVGLILCFLLGPIFFTLVQTSVEQGFRAGALVGIGIWVGDILYISAIYQGLAQIKVITQLNNFTLYMGLGGGLILLLFGIGTLLRMPKMKTFHAKPSRTSSVFSLFSKGFLINAINPFTVFFWLGITTAVAVKGEMNPNHAFWYFSGIVCTIISTDLGKIVLAKQIRRWMKPKHLIWIRKITGFALIAFGVVLLVRSIAVN